MADIDYKEILEQLKDAVLGPVKDGAKEFLEQNKDARDFIEDRAKRMAELGVEYIKAGTDAERESISERIAIAQQSIRTQLAGVALDADVAARAVFAKIVDTAVAVMVKLLPVLVAAI